MPRWSCNASYLSEPSPRSSTQNVISSWWCSAHSSPPPRNQPASRRDTKRPLRRRAAGPKAPATGREACAPHRVPKRHAHQRPPRAPPQLPPQGPRGALPRRTWRHDVHDASKCETRHRPETRRQQRHRAARRLSSSRGRRLEACAHPRSFREPPPNADRQAPSNWHLTAAWTQRHVLRGA